MEQTFVWEAADILPERDRILKRIGVTDTEAVAGRTEETLEHANRFFCQLARPVVKIRDVSLKEFAIIYRGEGLNTDDTPVCDVVAQSDCTALFAVTLGDIVSSTITDFFDCNEPHLGFILDAVCSEAAELTADRLEAIFLETVKQTLPTVPGEDSEPVTSRRFSPGYCGWHLSAQVKLLDFLKARQIGLSLNENYLMWPLKSISGVIAAGPERIFTLHNTYPACEYCRESECQVNIPSR